jgi:hypothetical protein
LPHTKIRPFSVNPMPTKTLPFELREELNTFLGALPSLVVGKKLEACGRSVGGDDTFTSLAP